MCRDQMARHRARIEVIAAADIEADHDVDGLAGKEIRFLGGGRPGHRQDAQCDEKCTTCCLCHLIILELRAPQFQRRLATPSRTADRVRTTLQGFRRGPETHRGILTAPRSCRSMPLCRALQESHNEQQADLRGAGPGLRSRRRRHQFTLMGDGNMHWATAMKNSTA